ncbi:hypothetical protein ACLKA6_019207 [Drosophila palustris]
MPTVHWRPKLKPTHTSCEANFTFGDTKTTTTTTTTGRIGEQHLSPSLAIGVATGATFEAPHSDNSECNGSNNSNNSFIPKSASPLESHKLPNATPTFNGNAGSGSGNTTASACSSASSSSVNFLGVRKPSLTLNSSDIRNNNDLFAFAKDMSPALELTDHSHSPMFTDLGTAISPANSNSSPTSHHHQLGRLFSLSPNSMRSYGNTTMKVNAQLPSSVKVSS